MERLYQLQVLLTFSKQTIMEKFIINGEEFTQEEMQLFVDKMNDKVADLEKQLDEKKKAADMWYNCYCDEQAKVRTLTSDMALVRDVVNRLSK